MITQDVKDQIIEAIVNKKGDLCTKLECGLFLDVALTYEHDQREVARETYLTPAEYEVLETYQIDAAFLTCGDTIIWEADGAEITELEQNLNEGWV